MSVKRCGILLAGIGMTVAAPALGDDLRGALLDAYRFNPTLLAARANLRATDESVPIARADGLPSANSTVTETEFVKQNPLQQAQESLPRLMSLGATLSVPIYSGGAVRNGVNAAKTRVIAGRADLRGTESTVFSQVVGAYMDVIQNEAITELNLRNVHVLDVNLQATTDRFQIGDLTRTDVAQSRSRLELARGNARAAQANLANSRERRRRAVEAP